MTLMLLSQTGQVSRQDSFPATISPTAQGTVATASATPHVKGSWAQIISSTTDDSWGFILTLFTGQTSGSQRTRLIDIGIGGAGSEVVILPNIPCTALANWVTQSGMSYFIPLFIPKNSRLSIRLQCNSASATVRASLLMNPVPNNRTFAAATDIGTDTSTSLCTAITPGVNSTYGSYTSVGSTTGRDYKAIQVFCGMDTNANMIDSGMYIDWGYSSTTLGRGMVAQSVGEAVTDNFGAFMPDYIQVPSGTQLQVRATQGVNTTASVLGVMLMGYY